MRRGNARGEAGRSRRVLTAALAGATSARPQLRTSDAVRFEAVLGSVVKSDATLFKAKAP